MKKHLAAAAILLASTAAGSAQTVFPCSGTDTQASPSGACPTPGLVPCAPDVLSQSPTSVDPNTILVDPAGTSAIPSPPTPLGMAPLIVPSDPLGTGISNADPFGGGSGAVPSITSGGGSGAIGSTGTMGSGGIGGSSIGGRISSPAIR